MFKSVAFGRYTETMTDSSFRSRAALPTESFTEKATYSM